MTGIAGLCRRDVACRFAGRGSAIVASGARAWRDAGMRKRRRLPRSRAVTGVASLAGGDVAGVLSGGGNAVVAGGA